LRFAAEIERAHFEIIVDAFGEAATLRMYAGSLPPRCADPNPEVVLVEIEIPVEAFAEAAGRLALIEPLIGKGTEAAGRGRLARSFRIFDEQQKCIVQGSVGAMEDGCDLGFDNPSVAAAQKIVINNFSFSMPE
jgi:hypothetical protein